MSITTETSVSLSKTRMYQFLIVTAFVISTVLLFVYLNDVHPYPYIDEAFHVGQTLRYCEGKFLEWDNKITTLPGLYLLTVIFLAPLGLCTLTWMRCINLLGTFLNFYLMYKIVFTTHSTSSRIQTAQNSWILLGLVFTITLFPPLFFWFFLYYTDVVSVNLVLLTSLLHLRQHYKSAAVAGALAVFVRQTNIIWVAVFAVERAVDLIEAQTPRSIETLVSRNIHNTPMHAKLVWNNIFHHTQHGPVQFFRFIVQMLSDLKSYALVGLGFIIFLIWNQGIVLGDRSAHTATVHLPQIFYYSIFSMFFAWPYMIPHIRDFFPWICKNWIFASVLFALATVIVHANTLVHPYVLADNRHYVFYIWNRLMGRYYFAKYLLIPIYGFAMYAHLACIRHLRYLSQIIYIGSVCAVLVPQLLLEPRYFIIPYICLRLNMKKPETSQISMELLTTITINCMQLYIFVNKVFYWADQKNPQRISW